MDAVRQSEIRRRSLKIERRTEIENGYTVLALEQSRHERGEQLLLALAEAVAAPLTATNEMNPSQEPTLLGETDI
jgi:hypothetical protein